MHKKIGTKLLLTYFFILLVAFFVSDIAFHLLSRGYLINETHKQLRTEGQSMAIMLSNIPLQDKASVVDKINERKVLKTAEKFVDADILIVNKDGKVVYKSIEELDKKILLQLARTGDMPARGYISEKIPIFTKTNAIKGYLLLFTKVKNIYGLNRLMRGTQLISFLIAGILALLVGVFMEKSLTRPIQILMNKMQGFSANKNVNAPPIKTGDEIEQLDQCFSDMIAKIRLFDEHQRRFLQNTSHELKTPLMSIQGYAEAIKDGIVEGKELEDSLDIIIEQTQRLKRTVEEIIYLTKLESTDENFRMETSSLQDSIKQAVKSVKSIADDKGIAINTQFDFDFIGMYDEEKMVRAFINVLGNAVRYAKKCININAVERAVEIEIIIADDGEGFKAGEEARVFERFYKGANGSTGIGLAITRAIIEGHKGSITAYSNTPRGASFKITIPKTENRSYDI